jgi:hypothetical protein
MTYKYVKESTPPEAMQFLLNKNWISVRAMPKPDIIVVNDSNDARSRFDLNSSDTITIRSEGPEIIKYRGNVSYYDRSYPLIIEVWTKVDRQRLRDMWKQVKGIIFDHLFAIEGYQIIMIKSYREMTADALNIWKSEIKISVDAAGVCVETNGNEDRFNK